MYAIECTDYYDVLWIGSQSQKFCKGTMADPTLCSMDTRVWTIIEKEGSGWTSNFEAHCTIADSVM